MSDVNQPLLRKAVEWAKVEATRPEWEREWNQAHFVWQAEARTELAHACEAIPEEQKCGTAYCIAGYVGQLLNPEYKFGSEDSNGNKVWDFAAEELGLTEEQADELFDGSNSIEDIERVYTDITGEPL